MLPYNCNVWDAHMGSVILMTATAVPFYYNNTLQDLSRHKSSSISPVAEVQYALKAMDGFNTVSRSCCSCCLALQSSGERVPSPLSRPAACGGENQPVRGTASFQACFGVLMQTCACICRLGQPAWSRSLTFRTWQEYRESPRLC